MAKNGKWFQSRKDIWKLLRSVAEAAILLYLLFVILRALFAVSSYEPYDPAGAASPGDGFSVVSYYGVERGGDNLSVGARQLEEQLKALRDSGFVTVSQQDLLDFYAGEKALPPRALFLMFEDGERGTAIFAERLLEQFNYLATMLTYSESFSRPDTNLLDAKDLHRLVEDTYWEVGTSGRTLSYINVFDRNGAYLGDLDSAAFIRIRRRVNAAYTHYLMDYLRDSRRVPREGYEEMAQRIRTEYARMRDEYEAAYGALPPLYAMPMNDTEYAENGKVGAVARERIYEMFQINFNRRVYGYNSALGSPMELTRCQPQPYWRTNHLLMRLWADSGAEMAFRTGDPVFAGQWETLEGVAEFQEDSVALTSLPDGGGVLRLKGSETLSDVSAAVTLAGNQLGTQELLLRWTDTGHISVKLKNGALVVSETEQGASRVLFVYDVSLVDGPPPHEISTPLSLSEGGARTLALTLTGDRLSLDVDGHTVADGVMVSVGGPGAFGLRAKTSVVITDSGRPADNIYDGVFSRLTVTDRGGRVYYDGTLHGARLAKTVVSRAWGAIIDWFIETT